MIFVTVGTTPYDFSRLIKEMDRIAGSIDDKVIMQIGKSVYEPKNAEFFRSTSREKIQEYYKNAKVVISHAAAGSILMAYHYKKSPILVPRMKKFEEHVDDHQLEGAEEWEKDGMKVIYDINDLENTLKSSMNDDNPILLVKNHDQLIINLKKYLDEMVR
ncbi:MAG: PssE/Cps14G family polysaccharide biosynthesis glycosyltransferase [Methanobacterium sp.]